MKRCDLSKIAGASVLALSLSILPSTLPASAQSSPNSAQTSPNVDRSGPTADTTPFQETKDDNNNWGWLGLIGLVGLANLFRKEPERVVNRDRDDVTAGPGSRM